MRGYFRCRHCGQCFKKNPRIKSGQHYCGSPTCQQARKNAWELNKQKSDSTYKAKRQSAKRASYQRNQGDQYQSSYRNKHPDYTNRNREQQVMRNKKWRNTSVSPKIVKTDTLSLESIGSQGVFEITPYQNSQDKKIVKTDTLLVQLSVLEDITDAIRIESG